MSSAGLVVIITVSLIGVLAIMGVLAFIYWHKHHHVNQRLIDEEDHSSCKRASHLSKILVANGMQS